MENVVVFREKKIKINVRVIKSDLKREDLKHHEKKEGSQKELPSIKGGELTKETN